MPSYEMPLEKMETYMGTNPCPEDFNQFWDNALQELQEAEQNQNIELIPATFQTSFAECYDLYFVGVRNARIHAKIVMPKNKKNCKAVLQFHGYGGNAGNWIEKLAYAAEGFVVAAIDCRGQSGLSEDAGNINGNTFHGHIIRGLLDKPENMLMRHIFLDTVQLSHIIMDMPQVDAAQVSVMGGSQGGGLSLACAALEPRIVKAAIDYPFLCDYKRVWELNQTVDGAYSELRTFFRDFDPLHKNEAKYFEQLGYIDAHNLATRIKAKTIMAITLMDEICPPSTQFAAFNNISSEKEKFVYPDFSHEYIPFHADITFKFLTGVK